MSNIIKLTINSNQLPETTQKLEKNNLDYINKYKSAGLENIKHLNHLKLKEAQAYLQNQIDKKKIILNNL